MSKRYPHVYIDIAIGARPVGRMVFELFSDLTPRTAENFRGLCTGEYGNVGLRMSTKKLHYQNSKIHRVIDGFMLQGGDITNGDGTGGASIYGPTFEDENFQRRHSCAGLLSMANRGRNTNSSQFFITLNPCPHLDGKHVVFGQIIYGMEEVVRRMAKTPVDSNNRPKLPITISDCGEVGDTKDFLRFDPFKTEELAAIRELNRGNVLSFEEKQKVIAKEDAQDDLDEAEAAAEEARQAALSAVNPKLKLLSDEIEQATNDDTLGKRNIPSEKLSKLQEIRQKINEARKLNLKAVVAEENINTNPSIGKKLKEARRQDYKTKHEEELEFKGIKGVDFLDKPAIASGPDKKQKNEVFGWDVFNDDSLYKAYKRRSQNLPFYQDVYEQLMEHPEQEMVPSTQKIERMAEDVKAQAESRKNFSRRKTFDPEEEVTYINERNRVYNKKLQRHFKEYAEEIKANLERGTALHN